MWSISKVAISNWPQQFTSSINNDFLNKCSFLCGFAAIHCEHTSQQFRASAIVIATLFFGMSNVPINGVIPSPATGHRHNYQHTRCQEAMLRAKDIHTHRVSSSISLSMSYEYYIAIYYTLSLPMHIAPAASLPPLYVWVALKSWSKILALFAFMKTHRERNLLVTVF